MEAESQREQRRRLTTDDFEPLVIIGRGAFGEVRHLEITYLFIFICVPSAGLP